MTEEELAMKNLETILAMDTGLIVISGNNKEARNVFINDLLALIKKRSSMSHVKDVYIGDKFATNGKDESYVKEYASPSNSIPGERLGLAQENSEHWEEWSLQMVESVFLGNPKVVVYRDLSPSLVGPAIVLGHYSLSVLSVEANSSAEALEYLADSSEFYGVPRYSEMDKMTRVFIHAN